MPPLIYEPKIQTYHIDFMNHVSNIVYVQWMEEGRALLLEAAGMPVEEVLQQGFGPILVDTEIRYLKELKLGDSVRAEVCISELSRATAWMDFRFRNQAGELAAKGRQRGLFIDLKSGRPRRLSAEEQRQFARFEADA